MFDIKYNWKKTGHGATDNLGKQLEKIAKRMNQNQFKTRYRYMESNTRFIKFVAKEFKLRKLANMQDKHLKAYVDHMRLKGNSDKYIKTELSGIRFIHNSIDNTKYELSDARNFSQEVALAFTRDGRADRAWTEKEYQGFKNLAIEKHHEEIAKVFEGIRHTGMRIDEIVSLKYQEVHNALRDGYLHLTNTKGGVPRNVPLTEGARSIFANVLMDKQPGAYVFTPAKYVQTRTIHKFKKQIQNFIYNHRDKIQDKDRTQSGHNLKKEDRGALTPHGLRHMFAREEYMNKRGTGVSKFKARLEVANMLGHGRDSVTFIYLGGIKE
ncbi:tyrosine-type recombinase/integrase (plasmid) [Vallitalea pronyensis]|uniref:Tyrosine-type recombinase/integrase n=1 Tax=Vallitalea pronyensis TaxID=1348613 RepID=A0A8J8MQK4_9FIRM|nr:tyrosine-type recombinase/integrase [Vallitalea pronyensis]QUI25884.1 tyrosine-type recombinase/integrase [Vallitalea pronyensis]